MLNITNILIIFYMFKSFNIKPHQFYKLK